LEELSDVGLPVASEAIVSGLSGVEWPGRLDLVEVEPHGTILFDAAHNPAAAATLAVFIRETYPHGLPLVIGAMADKDTDGIMSALRPAATEFICTASETPRAVPPSELAARVRRLAGGIPVTEEANPWRAVTAAWRRHTTVCVTGSLFLVGQVLSTAESKGATRRHDAR
jgi:dihydrofolate synthase/folylpolyglutamate synthase